MTMTNQKIQATEYLVGQNHATLSDTLNRLAVGLNSFRLLKSGSNLTLAAVGGHLVDINDNVYAVTSLPTLAPTSLSPDTLYYIYLYSNSGTATLEASTTGFTVDSKGRANKTGDASRRLMGMAYCVTGPAWSTNPLLVASYDHRRNRTYPGVFTANRTTTSTSYAELNSEIRVPLVAWADDAVLAVANFSVLCSVNDAAASVAIGVDGATAEEGGSLAANSTTVLNSAAHASKVVSVGYHYLTLLGKTPAAGTLTVYGGSTAGSRATLSVTARG